MTDIVFVKDKAIPVKVAITEAEQSRGLMGQKWPPPAMVFPYAAAGTHKFWMKNTPSPLDIVFCRAGKILEIVKGEPMSTRLVGPDVPCDMVVEFPFGTMGALGVKVGDEIEFRPTMKSLAMEMRHNFAK